MKQAQRLVAYAPNGGKIGPLPTPTQFAYSSPLDDLSALNLNYRDAIPGAELLLNPIEVAVEYSLDGVTWNEIPNGRYLRITRNNDPVSRDKVRRYTLPSYGWQLNKMRQMQTTGLNADGKRPFLSSTVGMIIGTLINEAHTRDVCPGLVFDFTSTHDSNGQPWALDLSIYYEPGLDLFTILNNLADQGMCDWWFEGRTLRIFNADTYLARHQDIKFFQGADIEKMPIQGTIEGIVHTGLFMGEGGATVELSNPTTPAPWGNWEGFVKQGGVSDETTMELLGSAYMEDGSEERIQFTADLNTETTKYEVWEDYRPGDYIWSLNDEGEHEEYRIRQINYSRADNGKSRVTLILNDRFIEREIRNARRTAGIVGGATSGGSGTPPVPPAEDKRLPAQVQALLGNSDVFVDSESGQYKGVVILDWDDVTTAENGSLLEITDYEIYQRRVSPQPETFFTAATTTGDDTSSANWGPFDPGFFYEFKVRARVNPGNRVGAWSDAVMVEIQKDTVPPPTPSDPALSSRMGVIKIEWDGLDTDGLPMPPDFDWVKVWRASLDTGLVVFPLTGTPEADVTVANSGLSLVNRDGGIIKYLDPKGIYLTTDADGGYTIVRGLSDAINNTQSIRFRFRVPVAPAAEVVIGYVRQTASDVAVMRMTLSPSGQLFIRDSANATVGGVAIGTITFGSIYDVTMLLVGGSTTAGQVTARLYDGPTMVGEVSATNANMTVNAINGFELGITSSNAATTVHWLDVKIKAGRTTEIASDATPGSEPVLVTVLRAGEGKNFVVETEVESGQSYSYAFSAVDRAGNESALTGFVPIVVQSVLDEADLEQQIIDAAEDAVLASGRNRITYSLSLPSTDGKEVTGDTWFQRLVDGTIVGQWNWDGTAYVPKTISHQVIASIDAGKITVGFLNGNIIKAGTVGTDKLVVGPAENLITDPTFQNNDINTARSAVGNWTFDKPNARARPTAAGAGNAIYWLTRGPYAGAAASIEDAFPVQAGDIYILSFWGQAAPDASINSYVRRWGPDKTYIGVTGLGASALTSTETRFTISYTVPAGTGFLMFGHEYGTLPGGAGTSYITRPFVSRRADAVTIADGVITAPKLVTGAVTADKIAAGAVTALKISADAIDGKTITGAVIRTAASGLRVELNASNLQIGDRPTTTTGTGFLFLGNGFMNVIGANSGDRALMTVDVPNGLIRMGNGTNYVQYNDVTQDLEIKANIVTGTRVQDVETGTGWIFKKSDGYANVLSAGQPFISFNAATKSVNLDDGAIYLGSNGSLRSGTTGLRLHILPMGILRAWPGPDTNPFFDLDPSATEVRVRGVVSAKYLDVLAADTTDNVRGRIDEAGSRIYITSTNGGIQLRPLSGSGCHVSGAYSIGLSGTRRALWIRDDGLLMGDPSTERLKLDIVDHEFDTESYLSLQPKSWVWKPSVEQYAENLHKEANGENVSVEEQYEASAALARDHGLIAERLLEAGFPEFVIRNLDGEVDGIHYDRAWVPLIPIVRDLYAKVQELETELVNMKENS